MILKNYIRHQTNPYISIWIKQNDLCPITIHGFINLNFSHTLKPYKNHCPQ